MLSTNLSRTVAALVALGFTASLTAQDECTGAIPVTLGVNGPYSNAFGFTTSSPGFTCISPSGTDMWFIYQSTCSGTLTVSTCGADFDTCVEVFDGSVNGCFNLTSVACNDDFCARQSQASWPGTVGGTYYIKVGGWNNETGNFPLAIDCDFDLLVEGTAEATPNTGVLSASGVTFFAGDDLRWNYNDVNSAFSGLFAVTGLNIGAAVPQPIAVTTQIPGLDLRWAGSSPTGFAFLLPPHMIGAGDYTLSVPAGLFVADGDTARIQGLVLDPVRAPGTLPAVPTDNALTFTYSTCLSLEDFESTTNGAGNYPTGWSTPTGFRVWNAHSGSTSSSNTGPTGANSGTQYMYCETSGSGGTGMFVLESPVYSAAQVSAGLLEFQLSRIGASIGTLVVNLGDGTGTFPTLLATYTGQAAVPEWSLESLTLPTQTAYQIQFFYTAGGTFTGDLAIDDVCTK